VGVVRNPGGIWHASPGGFPRVRPHLRALTVKIAQGVDRSGPIWEKKSGKRRIGVRPCPARGEPTIEIRARGRDDPVPRPHASRRLGLTQLRTREIVEKVFVPEKSVVTFKPGQVVQQRVEAHCLYRRGPYPAGALGYRRNGHEVPCLAVRRASGQITRPVRSAILGRLGASQGVVSVTPASNEKRVFSGIFG